MEQKTRKKHKLGSYPFVSVVFSITLALFVIGLFGMMVLHAKKLTTIIQENIEVQVFLHKQLASNEINRISRTIGSKNYVLKKDNIPIIRMITKEEAAQQFIENTGEDFKEFLGDNPLRDLFVVNIKPEYQSSDSLKMIQKEIYTIQGVYEVSYVESLVESINENLIKIGVILVGFFTALLIVVIILINNTIKLALFSQRFLIRSMQLVGATGRFIRNPFLKRASWYGFLSGIFSSLILWGVMTYMDQRVEDLQQLHDAKSLAILYFSLITLGMIVGYLSTQRAVRKYLKLSLDELY